LAVSRQPRRMELVTNILTTQKFLRNVRLVSRVFVPTTYGHEQKNRFIDVSVYPVFRS